jgi:hypothetical protein
MSFISPTLALGFVLATAYGAAFHFWQRGGGRALLRYLLAAWGGLFLGHLLGSWFGLDWLMVGRLRVLAGTLGALVALVGVWVRLSLE